MAVKTSPFTGWRLSGKDAEAFVRQIDESRPNVRAQEALSRGRALCKQMAEKGYSSVNPKKETMLKKAYSCVKRLISK
jgi:hypothetical protein